jgi:hypothetical protein
MKTRHLLLSILLILLLALVACGPSQEELDATATQDAANAAATQTAAAPTATPRPTDTPTPQPTDTPTPQPAAPEAETIMTDAQEAMAQVESFHMDMEMSASISQEGVSMEIPISFAADVEKSGNMQGTMSISFMGMSIDLEMISVDGVTYMTDPTTGEWTIASEAEGSPLPFDPEAIVVPQAGEGGLEDMTLVGQETLNGVDVYHLQGTLPGDAFAAAAGEETGVADLPAEVWIGVDDGLIYQLSFSGAIPVAGLE